MALGLRAHMVRGSENHMENAVIYTFWYQQYSITGTPKSVQSGGPDPMNKVEEAVIQDALGVGVRKP